ncbi:MAG: NAD(P)-dependent oxidoreductase [Chloroflexi bacterium]|nr:NAD(P)-dependent oxidoreductase [Chloroflexota bacterium]
MRVLVTGASGRIGSALAGYLKSQGHWVRGFDLVKPSDQLDDSIAGSLNDNDALEQALDGVEAVAHLAALMAWHPKDLTRLFEINVTGTFQLLSAAKGRGLKRFAFASFRRGLSRTQPAQPADHRRSSHLAHQPIRHDQAVGRDAGTQPRRTARHSVRHPALLAHADRRRAARSQRPRVWPALPYQRQDTPASGDAAD